MIEQSSRAAVPGRRKLEGLCLVESCSSTWIFDAATHRFRRLPRDARVSLEIPAPWSTYHRLEIDRTRLTLVVHLDERRTRILRAWLHADPCPRCTPGGEDASMGGSRDKADRGADG